MNSGLDELLENHVSYLSHHDRVSANLPVGRAMSRSSRGGVGRHLNQGGTNINMSRDVAPSEIGGLERFRGASTGFEEWLSLSRMMKGGGGAYVLSVGTRARGYEALKSFLM